MKYVSSEAIPGTNRTRLVTDAGKVFERGAIYMRPGSWVMLKRLSNARHVTDSEILQELILDAFLKEFTSAPELENDVLGKNLYSDNRDPQVPMILKSVISN